MTFNPNVPISTDFLSTSQGNLLSNNQALDASFGVDHSGFSATTHNGEHKQVTLFESRTSPTLTSPTSMIYSKTNGSGATAETNLIFSCLINTIQKNYQITNLPIVSGTNSGSAGGTLNYIDTPWNLRIYFGTTNQFSAGNRTVVFPTPFSIILFCTAVANNAAGTTIVSSLERNAMLHLGTGNMSEVNWSAMGRL